MQQLCFISEQWEQDRIGSLRSTLDLYFLSFKNSFSAKFSIKWGNLHNAVNTVKIKYIIFETSFHVAQADLELNWILCMCVCAYCVGSQLDTAGVSWGNAPIRWACRQTYEASSSLMPTTGGTIPGKRNKGSWMWLKRASQCSSMAPVPVPAWSSCLEFLPLSSFTMHYKQSDESRLLQPRCFWSCSQQYQSKFAFMSLYT